MSATPKTLLRLEKVETYYGSIQALKGISIEVHEGEIVTLIGANGAGKSTTLRSINGLNHPRHGTIEFMGKDSLLAVEALSGKEVPFREAEAHLLITLDGNDKAAVDAINGVYQGGLDNLKKMAEAK